MRKRIEKKNAKIATISERTMIRPRAMFKANLPVSGTRCGHRTCVNDVYLSRGKFGRFKNICFQFTASRVGTGETRKLMGKSRVFRGSYRRNITNIARDGYRYVPEVRQNANFQPGG